MNLSRNNKFDYHLQNNEQNQVERLVPYNQAKIHLAFRANVIYSELKSNSKKEYKNAAVALSEHMITICHHGFFGRSYKLLVVFHVNDITEMQSKSDELTVIKTIKGTYRIDSPASLRFARNVVRNFILSNPMMPPSLRFSFKVEDPSKFPKFNPPLSPSQQFQFTYNSSCSYFNVTYYHDIPRYFHNLISTGSCIFDFTQLPIHLMECGLGQSTDIRPITSSLMFDPYIFGINISDITRDDIISASAPIILMNPSLQIVRLIKTRSQKGGMMISNAMNQSGNQGVVYWDFSDNQLSDICYFADSLGRYQGQLITLRLNNCKMSNGDVTTLLTSLTENVNNHTIKQLALINNGFNQSNCEQLCYFLNLISSASSQKVDGSENSEHTENGDENEFNDIENDNDDPKALLIRRNKQNNGSSQKVSNFEGQIEYNSIDCVLQHLEIGPVKNPGIIIQSLNDRNIPLKILKIVDSSFDDESVRIFSNFLNSTTYLRELDISGSSIKDHQLAVLLSSLLSNTSVEESSLVLGLNRLSLHGNRYELIKNTLVEHQEKIVELSLNQNGLSLNDSIFKDLPEFHRLKKLSLAVNFTKKMTGIGIALSSILANSNISSLNISGNCKTGQFFGGYSLENEAIPFIKSLYTNSSLEELDISGNLIGDECIRMINEIIQQSDTLKLINIDNNAITNIDIIEDFLDSVSKSSSMIDYVFPADDIYNLLNNETDFENRLQSLSKRRQIAQKVVLNNMSNCGMYSSLSLLKDKTLDEIIDEATLELQEMFDLDNVQIEKHAAITEIVGLPLPYEEEDKHNANSDAVEIDVDNVDNDANDEEVYASKSLMSTVDQPESQASSSMLSSFKTLQFNSLCIRRPDAEQKLEEKSKFILQDVRMSQLIQPKIFKDEQSDDNDNDNDGDGDVKEEYLNPTEF